jgi:hypothetical protein
MGKLRKSTEYLSQLTDVSEEIRIKYLLNTDLELYRYVNLLSVKIKKKGVR